MAKKAGWYPDPAKQFGRRWWDGRRWSPWVAPFSAAMRTTQVNADWRPPGMRRGAKVGVACALIAWVVLSALLIKWLYLDDPERGAARRGDAIEAYLDQRYRDESWLPRVADIYYYDDGTAFVWTTLDESHEVVAEQICAAVLRFRKKEPRYVMVFADSLVPVRSDWSSPFNATADCGPEAGRIFPTVPST